MTDRELLELAAKAMGYSTKHRMNAERLELDPPIPDLLVHDDQGLVSTGWNPLGHDEHAFRMAVKFEFDIEHQEDSVFVNHVGIQEYQLLDWHNGDRLAATRRAIVKLAAKIGEQMEKS